MTGRAERRQEEATGGAKSRPKVQTYRQSREKRRKGRKKALQSQREGSRHTGGSRQAQKRPHRSRAAEQDRSRQPTGGPPLLCPVLCARLRHRTGRGPQGGSEEQPPAFVVSCRSRGSSGRAAQRAGAAEQRQQRQEGQRQSTAAPFSLLILRPSCWP